MCLSYGDETWHTLWYLNRRHFLQISPQSADKHLNGTQITISRAIGCNVAGWFKLIFFKNEIQYNLWTNDDQLKNNDFSSEITATMNR